MQSWGVRFTWFDCNVLLLTEVYIVLIWFRSGTIIGGGDLKSWDPRGPMIWDNFSICRTNCAIQMSYIRANPRTCREFTRVCCHVAWPKWWELWDSLTDFSQRWQGIGQEGKPRLFYALWRSEWMEKVSLSRRKISLISRFQWIISARACCTRKLLRLLKCP